jgi:hypothetical protein
MNGRYHDIHTLGELTIEVMSYGSEGTLSDIGKDLETVLDCFKYVRIISPFAWKY